MKVFIQNKSTKMFLRDGRRWTSNPEKARDFGTSLKAIDFLQQFKAEQTHIILKFDDPRYDIILHMNPGPNAPPQDQRL